MEDNRLNYLYQRFVTRTATAAEVTEFNAYLERPEAQQHLSALLEKDYVLQEGSLGEMSPLGKARIFEYVTAQRQEFAKQGKILRLWPRIAVAAALAIVVFGAGLLYLNRGKQLGQNLSAYHNDISPGRMGATLTLSTGRKIDLDSSASAELAREAGVVISKTSDGRLVYQVSDQHNPSSERINTLSTANGETYQVKLPDGTSAWLNAESSISFPASFSGLKQRTIQLKGEVYLEVAKDKSHPFIVKTDRQDIEVLGTHFNVHAYVGEPVKTALAEGSVKVSLGGRSRTIVPGQQTVVTGGQIRVTDADLDQALAWKDGNFDFDNEPISNIMTILSRWYDIEVDYQDGFRDANLTGSISRNRNISQVLKMLEQTKKVHFRIEGRRVAVMK